MSCFTEKLVFMTDPLCSWCWAMVPELQTLQEQFGDRLDFELKCAGLQVGDRTPLSEGNRARLALLWQQVAETTGQTFAQRIPDDANFIYHSELACRALEIMRVLTDSEPFNYYYRLQQAFYVDARNIADVDVLFQLAVDEGIPCDSETFEQQIDDPVIVAATHAGFDWCESQAISALPTLFLDRGQGPELISGGYATADYLIPDIRQRLVTH